MENPSSWLLLLLLDAAGKGCDSAASPAVDWRAMCYHAAMQTFTWNDIPEDVLNPLAGRKALHGKNITMARFRFDKGNVVAMHHHINDQITIIQSGKVRFNLDGEIKELSAGDFLHVDPDVPHGNEALEDTVIIELFSPIREDWIKGDDSYLRQK